eukprot:2491136-Lingulodinium_polyedra.AAC.1
MPRSFGSVHCASISSACDRMHICRSALLLMPSLGPSAKLLHPKRGETPDGQPFHRHVAPFPEHRPCKRGEDFAPAPSLVTS